MTNDQLQQVVDAENKRLNEIAVAKATERLRDIAGINRQIEQYQAQRARIQAEIAALQFDSVTVADILGESAPVTSPVVNPE